MDDGKTKTKLAAAESKVYVGGTSGLKNNGTNGKVQVPGKIIIGAELYLYLHLPPLAMQEIFKIQKSKPKRATQARINPRVIVKIDDAVFAVVGQLCSDDRLIRLGLLHTSLTLSMSAVKLVDRTTANLQA